MIKHSSAVLALAIMTSVLMPVDSAQAKQYLQNGAGVCKSALPVFDGNIRNRPLAISNEGTATAFVSCSALDQQSGASTIMAVWIRNRTAATVSVTCTLVTGNSVDGPAYFTKTLTFPASSDGPIAFGTGDNGGANFGKQANFSCGLPPGTEIPLITFVTTTDL